MSEKSDDKLINAFINPLAFLEVDEPWATHLNDTATPENILKYMCTPGVESNVQGFVERYKGKEKGHILNIKYSKSTFNI